MSEIQLVWPNKDLSLFASGETGYKWVQPTDCRFDGPLELELLTKHPLNARRNVLAIGDGLDVLDALRARTTIFRGGIRLVYIDPPFNTQVNFRQYRDTMAHSMWLSMMRTRLMALRSLLAEDASIWVHLDDAEVHRARAIMDEIFGESAFVASVVWQKKSSRDSRAAFSTNHDTILVYAPSGPITWKTSRNLLARDSAHLSQQGQRSSRALGGCPVHGSRIPKSAAIRHRYTNWASSASAARPILVRNTTDLSGLTYRCAHLVHEEWRWRSLLLPPLALRKRAARVVAVDERRAVA